MAGILFLVHRIPYPPNKGDKIRSFNILKALAARHEVYLAAFIDDKADLDCGHALERYCVAHRFIYLNKKLATVKSLKGFLSNQALTLPYYYHADMAAWIASTLQQHSIQHILVYSSSMAQYVMAGDYSNHTRTIDFVDMDSDKWRQYSTGLSWPLSWVYRREADKLLRFEADVAETFDKSYFVSREEAEFFSKQVHVSDSKVDYFSNGVDTEYFSPAHSFDSPYDAQDDVLVFTGAMDYWANVDAVEWFARGVLPELLAWNSRIKFYIVGSNPHPKVLELDHHKAVTVTGRVDDVRPYVQHAKICVVSLRIARGIQNKVLEAMAMQKPIVASPQAVEGINVNLQADLYVARDEKTFTQAIQNLLEDSERAQELALNARRCALESYSWDSKLNKLLDFIQDSGLNN